MQWKWTSNGVTPKYTQWVHLAHTNTHVVAGASTKHRNQMSQKLIASVYLNDHSCVFNQIAEVERQLEVMRMSRNVVRSRPRIL